VFRLAENESLLLRQKKHMLDPSTEEIQRRNAVIDRVLSFVRENRTIKLPAFDPNVDRPDDQFALLSVGIEPNDFSGTVGDFRYQFEGEEDLLHLMITRQERLPLSVEESQAVAEFLYRGVAPALVWLRPGEFSQHFYVGHDDLLGEIVSII